MAVKTYELIQILGDMLDKAQVTRDEAEREDLLKAADVIRATLLNETEGMLREDQAVHHHRPE